MSFIKTTEMPSIYRHLEKMFIEQILYNINQEDFTVSGAIKKVTSVINQLVDAVTLQIMHGRGLPLNAPRSS